MSKVNMMSAKDKKKGSQVPRLRFPEFLNAEEWEAKRLGELFSERQETNFPSLPLLSLTERNGIIPQEQGSRANTASGDKSKYLRVIPGDIAYNTMRMWEGRSALVGLEGIVSPAYTVCIPQKGNSSSFFSYYFKTQILIEKFHRYSQGLVNDTLNLKFKAFEKITVFSPRSFREQQKIADCLSSLDERIAAETNKLDALKAHKKGLLKQLFPAEGETLPQLRFPKFRNAGEWEEKNFRNICEKIMDGTHFSPKSKCGPFLYITSKNIQNGLLDLSNASSISEEEHRQIFAKCPVKINDILLTKDGANTGNCALNNLDFEFSLLSSVAVLRCKKGCIIQEFLYYTIASPFFQKKIKESISGQAITRITLEKIGSYRIFSPKEFEQQRIADCLSSLDELITAQSQKIELLKDHKKGLMQQLFPRIDEVRA